MATKTFEELKQQAEQIRDERRTGQNTATRIGNHFLDIINKIEETNNNTGDSHHKGYFETIDELKQQYPTPSEGDTAWVGTPYPGNVYNVVNGEWKDTGVPASEGGTSDYNTIKNKPSINGTELSGNKTLEEIGAASRTEINNLKETIPTVDDTLSDTSVNPVENKVVKGAIDSLNNSTQSSLISLQQKIDALSGMNTTFIGYYPDISKLPSVTTPCWALVGSISSSKPYAYYTSAGKPSGYSAGWNDLSGALGSYNFTNVPSGFMPTVLAYNYDNDKYTPKGSMRIIDDTFYIYAGAAFYIYEKCAYPNYIGTKSYLFENSSGEDIVINLGEGDTVCIDLDEAHEYSDSSYTPNSLALNGTIKVVSYGSYTARQIPICQRRKANITVNPDFLWLLFFDRIGGASRGDTAILGTNGYGSIEGKILYIKKSSPLFIYRNVGMNGKAYFAHINVLGSDFQFDFTRVDSLSTLVIDGKKLEWNVDSAEINNLKDIIKIVSGSNYSSNDIPIAHVRSGNVFIFPAFQSIFTSIIDTEVSAINRSNFLPYYQSICRAKRNTKTNSAAWKDRCNILHISDNHATSEDGYRNLREAVYLTKLNNINLHAVVNTGDVSDGFGEGTSKSSVLETFNRVRDIILNSNVTTLVQLGNHDANDYGGVKANATTKEEQWDNMFKALSERWTSVSFGAEYKPGVVSVSIEQGTWSENSGHRVNASTSMSHNQRIRSNNAVPLNRGDSYTVSVASGYKVFVIFFAEFVSNDIGTMANTVGTYESWQQSYTFTAEYDNMAIVVKKDDGSNIYPTDSYNLSVINNTVADSGVTLPSNPYRHYSYFDLVGDDFGKVRLIMLDMLDHDLPTGSGGELIYTCQRDPVYSQKQIDWLTKVALQVEDGTGIILCNHYPFDTTPSDDPSESLIIDGKYVQPWNMIPDIIKAWQDRTTLNKTYEDSVGSQNITVNVNFSNIGSSCEFICYLCGHTHYKTHKVVTGYQQMMLLEDSSGRYGTVYSDVVRLSGTVSSNAFSIISIDRKQGVIYRTSYGAYKSVDEVDKSRIEKINYKVIE